MAKSIKESTLLPSSKQKIERFTRDTAKRTRYFVFLLFGISLVAYLAWQLYQIITPPLLVIDYPPEGVTVHEQKMTISGQIGVNSQLTINQELVLPGKDGMFQKTVNLQSGINTFIFEASKRYGRRKDITRHVEYVPLDLVDKEIKGAYIDFNN